MFPIVMQIILSDFKSLFKTFYQNFKFPKIKISVHKVFSFLKNYCVQSCFALFLATKIGKNYCKSTVLNRVERLFRLADRPLPTPASIHTAGVCISECDHVATCCAFHQLVWLLNRCRIYRIQITSNKQTVLRKCLLIRFRL